jgi:hypothetical protein
MAIYCRTRREAGAGWISRRPKVGPTSAQLGATTAQYVVVAEPLDAITHIYPFQEHLPDLK